MFSMANLRSTVLYLGLCIFATLGKPNLKLANDPDLFVSCESPQQGHMLGLIPDPIYCDIFYLCDHAKPGSGYVTLPKELPCPKNLYYDFRIGKCEYDPGACYDFNKDYNDFFICAYHIDSEVGSNCTRLPDS